MGFPLDMDGCPTIGPFSMNAAQAIR